MSRYLMLLLVFGFNLFIGGSGCCVVSPDRNQIEEWISIELPRGSTDSDVRAFCARHHFFYNHNFLADKTGVELIRPLDGCDLLKPIATIEVKFDANGRLSETVTRTIGMTP